MKFDFKYQSPLEMIYDDPMEKTIQKIQKETDEFIYQTVINTGVKVDKDELVKALQYDRQQYEKGYADGYEAGKSDAREHGQWLRNYDKEYPWKCSICGLPYTSNCHNYCCQCGSWMEVFKVD